MNPFAQGIAVTTDDDSLMQTGTQIVQGNKWNADLIAFLINGLAYRQFPSFGTGVPDGGGCRSIYAGEKHTIS